MQCVNIVVHDIVSEYDSYIEEFYITQYVDDTQLFVIFSQSVSKIQRQSLITEIFEKIIDELLNSFGLRLNTKTDILWFQKEKQLDKKQLKALNVNSIGEFVLEPIDTNAISTTPQDESTLTPVEIFEEVITSLNSIKDLGSFSASAGIKEELTKGFKGVYSISDLIKSEKISTSTPKCISRF